MTWTGPWLSVWLPLTGHTQWFCCGCCMATPCTITCTGAPAWAPAPPFPSLPHQRQFTPHSPSTRIISSTQSSPGDNGRAARVPLPSMIQEEHTHLLIPERLQAPISCLLLQALTAPDTLLVHGSETVKGKIILICWHYYEF